MFIVHFQARTTNRKTVKWNENYYPKSEQRLLSFISICSLSICPVQWRKIENFSAVHYCNTIWFIHWLEWIFCNGIPYESISRRTKSAEIIKLIIWNWKKGCQLSFCKNKNTIHDFTCLKSSNDKLVNEYPVKMNFFCDRCIIGIINFWISTG